MVADSSPELSPVLRFLTVLSAPIAALAISRVAAADMTLADRLSCRVSEWLRFKEGTVSLPLLALVIERIWLRYQLVVST